MRGRPIRGAVCGLLFGLSLSVFLLAIGVVPLDSIVLAALPGLFFLLGIALGFAAPIRRGRTQAAHSAS